MKRRRYMYTIFALGKRNRVLGLKKDVTLSKRDNAIDLLRRKHPKARIKMMRSTVRFGYIGKYPSRAGRVGGRRRWSTMTTVRRTSKRSRISKRRISAGKLRARHYRRRTDRRWYDGKSDRWGRPVKRGRTSRRRKLTSRRGRRLLSPIVRNRRRRTSRR